MSLEIQSYNNSFNEFFNDVDHIIFPALWASEVSTKWFPPRLFCVAQKLTILTDYSAGNGIE